jgi:hypothetical protein
MEITLLLLERFTSPFSTLLCSFWKKETTYQQVKYFKDLALPQLFAGSCIQC